MTNCCFCASPKLTGIADCETGKTAHDECWVREQEKGHHLKTACDQLLQILGTKIKYNPFTKTWAVYDPDNHYKYFITNLRYCPFCGEELILGH